MLNAQTARSTTHWDGCQAGKAKVEGWIKAFMKCYSGWGIRRVGTRNLVYSSGEMIWGTGVGRFFRRCIFQSRSLPFIRTSYACFYETAIKVIRD